jgi:glycosyltransferase involved in cell wall biosynthesis
MRPTAHSSQLTAHGSQLQELVSVVIPAHNEEAYLEAALASVAEQSYGPDRLECIVADNGSTDETARVARDFASRHPHLTISVVDEPVAGVGRAKNRGARVARGDILIFLDADSRMDPDLVRDVVACYRAGNPAGSIRILADSDHPLDRGFFALMEVGKVLFGIRSQMMYCDRSLFLSVDGFHPDFRLAEDLEFLKRVRARVRQDGTGTVCHVRSSAIRTSPRRLRQKPYHLAMIPMFGRWLLAFLGIWRTRKY